MAWACELTTEAERDLRELPRNIQRRVARALDEMAVNPFQGDVKGLQGDEWAGVFAGESARIEFSLPLITRT